VNGTDVTRFSEKMYFSTPSLREKVRQAPDVLYAEPRWYACHTRARAEKKVAERLEAAGVEPYLPLLERERQWADRVKRVRFPLFPGYVFARFDLTRLGAVVRTPGVSQVLRPSGYPTPVSEEELAAVRRLVAGANETGLLPTPVDYLEPGQQVVVVSGPFQGMRGVLVEARGASRVVVCVSAIRQAVSVEMDRRLLRAVAA